jgi:hypothetical protein
MPERSEPADVDHRTVLIAAGGIVGFLVLFIVILFLVFPNLVNRPAPTVAQFPTPSVTTDERLQRIQLERAQNERLSGKNGTMPIERAMAIIAGKAAAAYGPVMGGAQ